MVQVDSCIKCGTNPSSGGGVCVACAIKSIKPQTLDHLIYDGGLGNGLMSKDFLTKKDKEFSLKRSYDINPIIKSQETEKKARQYMVINSLTRQRNIADLLSKSYTHNPNIKGYVSNSTKPGKDRYVFDTQGYKVLSSTSGYNRQANNGLYRFGDKSYSASGKEYSGNSKYTGSITYSAGTSTSSSASAKSSSGASSGGKK